MCTLTTTPHVRAMTMEGNKVNNNNNEQRQHQEHHHSHYKNRNNTTYHYYLVIGKYGVVNLRNQMKDMPIPPDYKDSDPYQETQLLFQECVTLMENETLTGSSDSDWVKISAPHQLTFDFYEDGKLHPYPGYVHRSELIRLSSPQVSCPMLFASERVIVSENNVPLMLVLTSRHYHHHHNNHNHNNHNHNHNHNHNNNNNNNNNTWIVFKEWMQLSIGTTLEYVGTREMNGIQWTIVRIYINESNGGEPMNAYIESSHVTKVLSNETIRNIPLPIKTSMLLSTGTKLLGWPYAWGGRSSFDKSLRDTYFTGMDCSGFISTIFWVALSIKLPRNAHDQFLVSRNVTRTQKDDFAVGDLLFLGKLEPPYKIIHVMMYIGDGLIMESSENTRVIPLTKKVNVDKMSDLYWGKVIVDRGVLKRFYWGRILEDPSHTS
jgi:hypothetical protein